VTDSEDRRRAYLRSWLLIGAGWLSTNVGYAIADLPVRLLLKEQLHLGADTVAAYFAIAQFTNYIKPIAGVLTIAWTRCRVPSKKPRRPPPVSGVRAVLST
jgi:hypothetical protein